MSRSTQKLKSRMKKANHGRKPHLGKKRRIRSYSDRVAY